MPILCLGLITTCQGSIPLLFKCKISKLVDEVYCGGTQVRVLPHTHTSYFIIQNMLLAPVDPELSLLVLQLFVQFPTSWSCTIHFPGFSIWTWVFPFGDYRDQLSPQSIVWRLPAEPLQFPYPHGRFPSSATCLEFSSSNKLKHHGFLSYWWTLPRVDV